MAAGAAQKKTAKKTILENFKDTRDKVIENLAHIKEDSPNYRSFISLNLKKI